MEKQFDINDYTAYDIGKPHTSVRFPRGYIAHTDRGIIVCLDSGLRYTCSYQHLLSTLKVSAYNPDDVQTRDNINDILGQFKSKMNTEMNNLKRENEQMINNLLNNKNYGN